MSENEGVVISDELTQALIDVNMDFEVHIVSNPQFIINSIH